MVKRDADGREIPENIIPMIEELARCIRIIDMYSADLRTAKGRITIELRTFHGIICNWDSQRLDERVIPALLQTMAEERTLYIKELERLTKVVTG